jgi:hypothetical protein
MGSETWCRATPARKSLLLRGTISGICLLLGTKADLTIPPANAGGRLHRSSIRDSESQERLAYPAKLLTIEMVNAL